MSVSATNTPPYGPKWPFASGSSYTSITYSLNERGDLRRVLDAFRRLDAAGDVHRARLHAAHRFTHVFRGQAAGQDDRQRQRRRDQAPVEHRARSAVQTFLERVEQQRLRAGKIAGVL